MKIVLKNLDHRNIGSVVTWQHQARNTLLTKTSTVVGFTHGYGSTVLHTPLGDYRLPSNTEVDVQLPKQSVLLAQLLTELEDQG